jgi:hypothetical protein
VTDHYYLLIPPEGLLEVLAGGAINIEATLAARGGEGRLVSVVMEDNHQQVCRVSWFHSPTGAVNPRAREALVDLTDMHMIFTGPVLIYDADEQQLGRVVQLLSSR